MGSFIKNGVLSLCTGSQKPIQKTQQCSTAKQRFMKKEVRSTMAIPFCVPVHQDTTRNGIEVRKVSCCTNQFQASFWYNHDYNYTPLLNTICAMAFESRELLLWMALSLLQKTVVAKYCLQVLLLLSRICIFCLRFFVNDKWVWCNTIMFKCRLIDL